MVVHEARGGCAAVKSESFVYFCLIDDFIFLKSMLRIIENDIFSFFIIFYSYYEYDVYCCVRIYY